MAVQTSVATAPAIGLPGQLYDNDHGRRVTSLINEEATAEIAFGLAVKFGTNDLDALLPAAETDKIAGIVIRSQEHDKGSTNSALGDTGLKPGALMNVLRRGKIYATCDGGCNPGDLLWIRAVAGVGETLGALEAADDSTDMVDSTNHGVWLTTAADGEIAVLEVDFTGSST